MDIECAKTLEVSGGSSGTSSTRQIIVFEAGVLADVVGAADVSGIGDGLISTVFPGATRYAVSVLSISGGMIMSPASVQSMTSSPASVDKHQFDTPLIASGTGDFDAYRDPYLIAWLRQMRGSVRRIAAICAGLALRLLENDPGPTVARRVAQSLVVRQRRRDTLPANQTSPANAPIRTGKIHKASLWHDFLLNLRLETIRQQLTAADLPADKTVRRCGLFSGEHIAKLFRKHKWISPAEYRKGIRPT